MLRTKLFKAKTKSKKGFTLVEAISAVFVLAIVFVGVLNAVAFSRQMVFTNNARDKASDKAQLVADEIFSTAVGYDPATGTVALMDALDSVLNYDSDPQNAGIGKVNFVSSFTDPSAMDESMVQIECIISATTADYTDDVDGTVSKQNVVELGWSIKVRAYYREIGNSGDYRCVDVSAFAPTNYIDD